MSELKFFDDLEAELERVASGLGRRPPVARRLVRPAVAPVVIVAIAAVALSLSGNGNPGPSLLARAYAATTPRGQILFYRTTSYEPGEDRPDQYAARQRSVTEVWTDGATEHVVGRDLIGGAPGHRVFRLSLETVVVGDRYTGWQNSPQEPAGRLYTFVQPHRSATCTAQLALTPSSCGTPLEAVRRLYRSGALHLAGKEVFHGQTVDVLTETTPGPPPSGDQPAQPLHTRVLVNARTLTPVEITVTSGVFWATTTFADFTRLPPTAANERLLKMRSHPGAAVLQLPLGGVRVTTVPRTRARSSTGKSLRVTRFVNGLRSGPDARAAGAVELVHSDGRDGLMLVVTGLPHTSSAVRYGIWLAGASNGAVKLLGYVSAQRGRIETEPVLPESGLGRFDAVELTTVRPEGVSASARPGSVILRAPLR